jgi:hypothetical protein
VVELVYLFGTSGDFPQSAGSVTDGAKLRPRPMTPTSTLWLLTLVAFVPAACAPAAPVPSASYDATTRRLVQMVSDLDHDGRPDHWAYLEGARLLRTESDANGDGRIDRWEYFDAAGRLSRVGTASRGDGVEDEWAWAEDESGERRLDRSTARDGRIDRREIYQGEALIRVEQDSSGDGRIDTWQTFQDGRLREVRLDSTGRGRPDRRLRYDVVGQDPTLETDPDGDGVFVPVRFAPSER